MHDDPPRLDSPRRSAAICTEAEIAALVHQFYARVRADEVLGPVFDAHIDDWDAHLQLLCDFWSSLLLFTARFEGAPMPRHIALPGLTHAMFARWLNLFEEVARQQPNARMADRAIETAGRIAQRLWTGYQRAHEM